VLLADHWSMPALRPFLTSVASILAPSPIALGQQSHRVHTSRLIQAGYAVTKKTHITSKSDETDLISHLDCMVEFG